MNLYINKITIEKDGKTAESYTFRRSLSVVEASADLYDAVSFISGKEKGIPVPYEVRFVAEVETDEKYIIHAVKKKNKTHFSSSVFKENGTQECTEEFFESVSAHKELDTLNFFKDEKRSNYSNRIYQYKNILECYPKGEFAKRTEGVGLTRSFQGFISQYIRNYKPCRINEDKDFYIKIKTSGVFEAGYVNSKETVYLSESEKMIFHFLCFLSLADFWRRCEKIRNLHSVNRPLVISDLTERIDESYNLNSILKKTDCLDRQTVVFVPENFRKTEYSIEKST